MTVTWASCLLLMHGSSRSTVDTLPEGIELLYGSSDAGGAEYIANAAIAHCDKISSLLLKHAESEPEVHYILSSPGSPFARCRIWAPPNDRSEVWSILPTG